MKYGIADVLALLRDLPLDRNPELVMQVVRKTLESHHVRVDDLVSEARTRAGQLEQSIGDLEREIASRQATVLAQRQELAEMKRAVERLGGGSEWDRPSVMKLEERDLESIATPEPMRAKGKGSERR